MRTIKDLDNKINKLTNKVIGKKKKENVIVGTCAEFFSGVFVTALVGYFLDYLFSTKYIFLTIFVVLGFIVGFINIYRFLNREIVEKDEH